MVSLAMLDPAVLPVFFLAVLALAVAPGPDLTLIVSHALARGTRAGVWCSVGIALAGFLQTALRTLSIRTRQWVPEFTVVPAPSF